MALRSAYRILLKWKEKPFKQPKRRREVSSVRDDLIRTAKNMDENSDFSAGKRTESRTIWIRGPLQMKVVK